MLTVTVSQLNRYVKAMLEENAKLRDLYVKGEISGFHRNAASGHCYFTLKDAAASVRAVMFAGNAGFLRFEPENGMAVLVRASASLYERDGAYQLYVTDIQPHGAGAVAVALEQLKRKLAAEGIFDERNKKPIPTMPTRVGVVTSKNAAALQDIITVLERRYPACTVVLAPAQVQGEGAARSIVRALATLDLDGGCDVILLARGGGSAEDLACFNDEQLVLTVAGCETPIISAVGHETDFTLCDLAADLRAPTPSAAAELAVPDREELRTVCAARSDRLAALAQRAVDARRARLPDPARLKSLALRTIERNAQNLRLRAAHPLLRSPAGSIERAKERLDISHKALYNSICIIMQSNKDALAGKAALLDSLSPLSVLDRGYGLVYREEKLVTGVSQLARDDRVRILLRDGEADAQITEVRRKPT